MSKIKIDSNIFDHLIEGIRECDDEDELFVEVMNSEGDFLIYDNGHIIILHQGYHFQIKIDQLVDHQKKVLHQVLLHHIERIIDNIISEACNVG